MVAVAAALRAALVPQVAVAGLAARVAVLMCSTRNGTQTAVGACTDTSSSCRRHTSTRTHAQLSARTARRGPGRCMTGSPCLLTTALQRVDAASTAKPTSLSGICGRSGLAACSIGESQPSRQSGTTMPQPPCCAMPWASSARCTRDRTCTAAHCHADATPSATHRQSRCTRWAHAGSPRRTTLPGWMAAGGREASVVGSGWAAAGAVATVLAGAADAVAGSVEQEGGQVAMGVADGGAACKPRRRRWRGGIRSKTRRRPSQQTGPRSSTRPADSRGHGSRETPAIPASPRSHRHMTTHHTQ